MSREIAWDSEPDARKASIEKKQTGIKSQKGHDPCHRKENEIYWLSEKIRTHIQERGVGIYLSDTNDSMIC